MNLLVYYQRQGITLWLEEGQVRFKSAAPLTSEQAADLKARKLEITKALEETPETPQAILPLPWQLERLISAASSDLLPKGPVALDLGRVPDLSTYVLAWGCAYLVGDRDEAMKRLWQAYRAWQGVN